MLVLAAFSFVYLEVSFARNPSLGPSVYAGLPLGGDLLIWYADFNSTAFICCSHTLSREQFNLPGNMRKSEDIWHSIRYIRHMDRSCWYVDGSCFLCWFCFKMANRPTLLLIYYIIVLLNLQNISIIIRSQPFLDVIWMDPSILTFFCPRADTKFSAGCTLVGKLGWAPSNSSWRKLFIEI